MSRIGKINVTRDYRMFHRNVDNRPTHIKKHKKLLESLQRYGFLKCFPIVCRRDKDGNLVVKDGQHRLVLAESLGLEVYWIEEEVDFDIADINCTSRIWVLRDYAEKFAESGNNAYQVGMEFSKANGLSLGTSFALLAGVKSFTNCQEQFVSGTFRVKDKEWADAVASIYVPICNMSPNVRNTRFIEACMSVCRVKDFDSKRLLQGAERCRDKLVSYSTRDMYLEMLQTIYNFGRKQLFPLKIQAEMAMRERNPTKKPKDKPAKESDA